MSRCPECGLAVATGPNCDVADTDCFDVTGSGTEADPHIVVPILSADVDQLLTCTASGFYATEPTSLSNPPACQVYHQQPQSIANNTLTTLAFNTEMYDTDTMHDITTNNGRITFTTAGIYIVTLNCTWKNTTAATGDRIAQIRKNATTVLAYESKRAGGADLLHGHSICIEISVAAADYVEARVQQTSGAALNIIADSWSPVFSAARVA